MLTDCQEDELDNVRRERCPNCLVDPETCENSPKVDQNKLNVYCIFNGSELETGLNTGV